MQTTLIHLGAKYAPCMRWDETLSREIKESRLKERDTACCIRKDRAGCVQSPKTECTKVGGETAGTDSGGGKVSMSHPKSNWVSGLHFTEWSTRNMSFFPKNEQNPCEMKLSSVFLISPFAVATLRVVL